MIRVLLAEDDVELSMNIVEILELEGFDVTAVSSAEQAIEASGREHFDIALLDLLMSGMTGVEAISNLRQNQPFLAVVIITAYATVDTAVDAMKKGALSQSKDHDDWINFCRKGKKGRLAKLPCKQPISDQ